MDPSAAETMALDPFFLDGIDFTDDDDSSYCPPTSELRVDLNGLDGLVDGVPTSPASYTTGPSTGGSSSDSSKPAHVAQAEKVASERELTAVEVVDFALLESIKGEQLFEELGPSDNKQRINFDGTELIVPRSNRNSSHMSLWHSAFETKFLKQYYRNQKMVMMCFAECLDHGDFKTMKLSGDTAHKGGGGCSTQVRLLVDGPTEVPLAYVHARARFIVISPQASFHKGRSIRVDDALSADQFNALSGEQDAFEGQWAENSTAGEATAAAGGDQAGVTRRTAVFKPHKWAFDVALPRNRVKKEDTHKVPLYALESLVFQETISESTGEIEFLCVSRKTSDAFHIASVRTLLREMNRMQKAEATTPASTALAAHAGERVDATAGDDYSRKRQRSAYQQRKPPSDKAIAHVMIEEEEEKLVQKVTLESKREVAFAEIVSAEDVVKMKEKLSNKGRRAKKSKGGLFSMLGLAACLPPPAEPAPAR